MNDSNDRRRCYAPATDGVGHRSEIANDLFQRLGFERGITGDGFVEIIHVSLVMATVVDFHGERVNVGFERGFVVRQIWQFVGHNVFRVNGSVN